MRELGLWVLVGTHDPEGHFKTDVARKPGTAPNDSNQLAYHAGAAAWYTLR